MIAVGLKRSSRNAARRKNMSEVRYQSELRVARGRSKLGDLEA